MQSVEDEYVLDGELFSLQYFTVDSDAELLSSSFFNDQFRPQGGFRFFYVLKLIFSINRFIFSNCKMLL